MTELGWYWTSRWTDELHSRNAAGRVEVPAVHLPCAGLPSLPAALFARWGCGHPADWLDTRLLPCATPGCPHDSVPGASYMRAEVPSWRSSFGGAEVPARSELLLRCRKPDGWHWRTTNWRPV